MVLVDTQGRELTTRLTNIDMLMVSPDNKAITVDFRAWSAIVIRTVTGFTDGNAFGMLVGLHPNVNNGVKGPLEYLIALRSHCDEAINHIAKNVNQYQKEHPGVLTEIENELAEAEKLPKERGDAICDKCEMLYQIEEYVKNQAGKGYFCPAGHLCLFEKEEEDECKTVNSIR